MMSLPSSPNSASSPPAPYRISLPSLPWMVSAPSVPIRILLRLLPLMMLMSPTPSCFPIRGALNHSASVQRQQRVREATSANFFVFNGDPGPVIGTLEREELLVL